MALAITGDLIVKALCVALVIALGYFDYLYVMRLVDNYEMYTTSPQGPNLMNLWYTGLAGYVVINLLIAVAVKWMWK